MHLITQDHINQFFENKPESFAIFQTVRKQIEKLGPSSATIASQISYGNKRKFAWFWLYNVTAKNPNGVLHLMLAIDKKMANEHVREITQIGQHRWNHQIVIHSLADAESAWLKALLIEAYRYSQS